MSVLVDNQLDQRLTTQPPLATGVPKIDYVRADARIQAASLDLTIGDIYIPGTAATERACLSGWA